MNITIKRLIDEPSPRADYYRAWREKQGKEARRVKEALLREGNREKLRKKAKRYYHKTRARRRMLENRRRALRRAQPTWLLGRSTGETQ